MPEPSSRRRLSTLTLRNAAPGVARAAVRAAGLAPERLARGLMSLRRIFGEAVIRALGSIAALGSRRAAAAYAAEEIPEPSG
ncbi:MAG: hypothetical protein WD036_05420 [Bauldia sp.]